MTFPLLSDYTDTAQDDPVGKFGNTVTKPTSGDSWIFQNRQNLRGTLPGRSSTSFGSLYSPVDPSPQVSPEGIVQLAISVVSDTMASNHDSTEGECRKDAKRRMTDGGMEKIPTTSSKEFIYKLSETFRQDFLKQEALELNSDRESDGERQTRSDANVSSRTILSARRSKSKAAGEHLHAQRESDESDLEHDAPKPKQSYLLQMGKSYSRPTKHTSSRFPDDEGSPGSKATDSTLSCSASTRSYGSLGSAQRSQANLDSTPSDLGYADPDKGGRALPWGPGGMRRRNSCTDSTLSKDALKLSAGAFVALTLDNVRGRTLNGRSRPSHPQQASMAHDGPTSSTSNTNESVDAADPYGYEDMGMDTNHDHPNSGSRTNNSATNNEFADLGYEDADASKYGYGDTMERTSPRQPLMRRNSITKYSLESINAASYVRAAMNTSYTDRGVTLPRRTNSSRVLPQHTSSFLSETSYRSTRSAELGFDSSDEDDDGSVSVSSSDDESSVGEESAKSITVPLKDGSSRLDGPMRLPARRDSMRSFASRSTRSVHTIDSDGDSLAPDLKSLCSISQHERTPDSHVRRFMSSARRTASNEFIAQIVIAPSPPYMSTSPLPSPELKPRPRRPQDNSMDSEVAAIGILDSGYEEGKSDL